LLVGGWLTRGRRRSFVVVEPDLDGDECAELGTELAGAADRVGLLVMGDGSARRDERAPGWLDARAVGFDATCASALASGEPDALLALDRSLADELMVAGLPAWQVLAGAARGGEWTAEMTYDEAPYGVGYFVSLWRGSR
jgi:aromatic ring-opening dioxygenase LigB subunit